MGGIGSTRWAGHKRKTRTEECVVLDVVRILGEGNAPPPSAETLRIVRPSSNWGKVFVRYELHYPESEGTVLTIVHDVACGRERRRITQRILFQTTTPHFGGRRWWFSCPLEKEDGPCKRRTAKLYLPPSDQQFGCRSCHDLSYESRKKSRRQNKLLALAAGERPKGDLDALLMAFSVLSQNPSIRREYAAKAVLEALDQEFGRRQ